MVREGYSVRVAPDGRTAQQLIDSVAAPALVLLDVTLPHVDGYELLTRLRGSESWSSVPVIIVSARSQEQDIVRGLGIGADDYVAKPFKPDELRAQNRRLVKRPAQLVRLVAATLIENFGYHQLVLLWRLEGFWRWFVGAPAHWGDMKRSASWQKDL